MTQAYPVTQMLRDDHKRIRGLFRQFEAIGLRANEMERGVMDEIFMELEIHAAVEEEVFYAALISALQQGGSRMTLSPSAIDLCFEEHRAVQATIDRLRKLTLGSERFNDLFEDLIESVEAHITEEEAEVLPEAESVLRTELPELATRIEELRAHLTQEPRYRDARPKVVQNPNGGEQKRVRPETKAA
jgi:hypothetical protein